MATIKISGYADATLTLDFGSFIEISEPSVVSPPYVSKRLLLSVLRDEILDAGELTLGSTAIALGGTVTTVTGLTLSGGTLSGDTTLPASGQISSAGWLGILGAPDAPMTVNTNTDKTAMSLFSETLIHAIGSNSNNARIFLDGFAGNPNFSVRRANGTKAAPTAVLAGQQLGGLTGFGYGATGYSSGSRATIIMNALEAWTDSAQGAYVTMAATPAGSTTAQTVISVTATGTWLGSQTGSAIVPADLAVGKTAGTARVYNSYTDASNGEWAYLGSWHTANVATFGTAKNGTGTARDVSFVYDGTERLRLTSTGITLPGSGQITSAGNIVIGGTQSVDFSPPPVFKSITNNAVNRIELAGYAAGSLNYLTFKSAGGTPSAPTASAAGHVLGTIQAYGYDGSVFASQSAILFFAREAWTGSARGQTVEMYATPLGSTTLTKNLLLSGAGAIVMPGSATAAQAQLHVGTTAATARIYNSFTDASNGEWAYLGSWGFSSNVAAYGTDKNGSGTARDVVLVSGGTIGIRMHATTQLLAFGPSAALTSSFPAWKRSSTAGQLRLGDDSDYAPFEAATLRAKVYTVATLPTVGTSGRRASVSDALAPAWNAAIVGGGAVKCNVTDDGTTWNAG